MILCQKIQNFPHFRGVEKISTGGLLEDLRYVARSRLQKASEERPIYVHVRTYNLGKETNMKLVRITVNPYKHHGGLFFQHLP